MTKIKLSIKTSKFLGWNFLLSCLGKVSSCWAKCFRMSCCETSTGRPFWFLVLSWSKHQGVSKQSQAKITHSPSYSCCGMQASRIVDWLMGCSKTGAGVQYYLNNHKIMSFSVPRPPTMCLSMFWCARRRGVSTWGWWKQLTKPQLYCCRFYSLNRLWIISRT